MHFWLLTVLTYDIHVVHRRSPNADTAGSRQRREPAGCHQPVRGCAGVRTGVRGGSADYTFFL